MLRGFISYAHADARSCDEFRVHISSLEKNLNMKFWHDSRIHGGQNWNSEISEAIESASVFVHLLTPTYFDSIYITETEYPAISAWRPLRRQLEVPILVRECLWDYAFGPLQVLPHDGRSGLKAVERWRPRDHGWNAANVQLRRAIVSFFALGDNPVAPGKQK